MVDSLADAGLERGPQEKSEDKGEKETWIRVAQSRKSASILGEPVEERPFRDGFASQNRFETEKRMKQ